MTLYRFSSDPLDDITQEEFYELFGFDKPKPPEKAWVMWTNEVGRKKIDEAFRKDYELWQIKIAGTDPEICKDA